MRHAALVLPLLVAVPARSQWLGVPPDRLLSHPAAGGRWGFVVASAGDVNRDGFGDLLLTDPSFSATSANQGAAFIYLGGPGGGDDVADWSFMGANARDVVGEAAAGVGDIDHDGYDDVAVGGLGTDTTGAPVACVWLFKGSVTGLEASPALRLVGSGRELFGSAILGADITGDGNLDLVIGCRACDEPGGNVAAGSVMVFPGDGFTVSSAPVSAAFGHRTLEGFGWSLVAAGDIDQDGHDDVIIDDFEHPGGRLELHRGSPSGLLPECAWTLDGTADFRQRSIAAGDVNGDGRTDFLLGQSFWSAPGGAQAGRVRLFLGTGAGHRADPDWLLEGTAVDERVGTGVALADVNGDGYDDILMGHGGSMLPRFGVSVVSGASCWLGSAGGVVTTTSAVVLPTSAWRSQDVGRWMRGVGDLDGDGADEWALPGADQLHALPVAIIRGRPAVGLALTPAAAASVDCDAATTDGATLLGGGFDEVEYEWTTADPALVLGAASGVVPPGADPRPVPGASLRLDAAPCAHSSIVHLSVRSGTVMRDGHTIVTFDDRTRSALLGVPPASTADCDLVPGPAVVTALDTCDPAPLVAFRETSIPGPCPGRSTLVRRWDAVDRCGNLASAEQLIDVTDTTPPVVSAAARERVLQGPPNHRFVRVAATDIAPAATEACSMPVTWRVVACASSEPADGLGDGHTSPDCLIDLDRQALRLRAERSGRVAARRYAVTLEARDACGNASLPVVAEVVVVHDRRDESRR